MTSDTVWFDAFRDNGGPILYSSINRTPAVEDVLNIFLYITFSTLFVAFLIILPGIRKERLSTFISVTISLFVGAVILITNFGTSWHVASASISSPYRAFSREKIFADVGVRVGLQSVNITLKATPVHRRNEEINYNERFYWIGRKCAFSATEMKQEFQTALAKGLPFPILTIAEYLSQDGEGFCWGRRYRLAGYYSTILLWIAFSTWILMNLLLCAVPRYGAYTMQITGVIMLLTNAIYALLLPRKPLVIPFEGGNLTFTYGWCFWIVLIAGITAVIVGAVISIVDTLFPNKFSTILEVDYDTPYRYFVGNDAHLIGVNGMAHNHKCQHHFASATCSAATDSTCCGPALTSQNSTGSRDNNVLVKTKSDASTSTTNDTKVETETVSNGVITTTADIEMTGGVTNEAFQKGDDDEDSDVSTTIIDGKRAVSIHNFGKFAAQQQQREGKENALKRNAAVAARRQNGASQLGSLSTGTGSGTGSGTIAMSRRSSQIHIDLPSSAAMW